MVSCIDMPIFQVSYCSFAFHSGALKMLATETMQAKDSSVLQGVGQSKSTGLLFGGERTVISIRIKEKE